MDLNGTSAIVTGGASGIGAATARKLADRGAAVVVADLQADNPGTWAYHCHNIYHAETGMTTVLGYQS